MIEYLVQESDGLANQKNLTEFGSENWELVQIIKDDGRFYYYFLRRGRNNKPDE